jgi:hypothetical protein
MDVLCADTSDFKKKNFVTNNAFQEITAFVKSYQNTRNIIECSLKFLLKVGVEEWIVNAPRITDHGSAI